MKALTSFLKRLPKIHINPDVMMFAGMATTAAGTVTACIATLKLGDIIEDHMSRMEIVRKETPEDELGKATVMEYGKTIWKSVKLYSGPVALIAIGNGMMYKSHLDLKQMNVGLTASLMSLENEFENHRAKTRELIGEEAEQMIYDGGHKAEGIIFDKNGKEKKVTKVAYTGKPSSPDAVLFDESNTNWEKAFLCNYRFIMNQLSYAQQKLDSRGVGGRNGWLTKNEVLELLNFEPVADGFVKGWRSKQPDGSRTIIDFGLNSPRCQDFRDGIERNVWLVLNCDKMPLGVDYPTTVQPNMF